jgi:hypothetical protein
MLLRKSKPNPVLREPYPEQTDPAVVNRIVVNSALLGWYRQTLQADRRAIARRITRPES